MGFHCVFNFLKLLCLYSRQGVVFTFRVVKLSVSSYDEIHFNWKIRLTGHTGHENVSSNLAERLKYHI